MIKIEINGNQYKLIKNYKDAFNQEELLNKFTDYFTPYDYILGDWSYGKLRLKGFCEKNNKIYKEINDINTIEQYIKENCPFECKHFIIKKS